jgi:hypothetical protein
MSLPISRLPLIELAEKTSSAEAVDRAIKQGVIRFFLEAWTEYAYLKLKETKMLATMTPVEALTAGRELFEDIEDDFLLSFKTLSEKIEVDFGKRD